MVSIRWSFSTICQNITSTNSLCRVTDIPPWWHAMYRLKAQLQALVLVLVGGKIAIPSVVWKFWLFVVVGCVWGRCIIFYSGFEELSSSGSRQPNSLLFQEVWSEKACFRRCLELCFFGSVAPIALWKLNRFGRYGPAQDLLFCSIIVIFVYNASPVEVLDLFRSLCTHATTHTPITAQPRTTRRKHKPAWMAGRPLGKRKRGFGRGREWITVPNVYKRLRASHCASGLCCGASK